MAPMRPAGAADAIRFCVDTSSPSAAADRTTATAAAKAAGTTAQIVPFNGHSGDDEGFSLKAFRRLAGTRCDLVMGFPVEPGSEAIPPGMRHTRAYRTTGYVLVSAGGSTLEQLPPSTRVAVAFNTPANLLVAGQPRLRAVVYDSDSAGLDALNDGKVGAVAAWKPSFVEYRHGHTAARDWQARAIDQPHARWEITALFLPEAAEAAKRFEQGLEKLQSGSAKKPTADNGARMSDDPATLFSVAQAQRGAQLYSQQCFGCHGAKLEGVVGPALKGPGFASPDDGLTVGGIFTFLSQRMPLSQPGSLEKQQYVDLMAFLLRENGYPAGTRELTYKAATASRVPLVYRENDDGSAVADSTTQ